jgi:hypothetical protein
VKTLSGHSRPRRQGCRRRAFVSGTTRRAPPQRHEPRRSDASAFRIREQDARRRKKLRPALAGADQAARTPPFFADPASPKKTLLEAFDCTQMVYTLGSRKANESIPAKGGEKLCSAMGVESSLQLRL